VARHSRDDGKGAGEVGVQPETLHREFASRREGMIFAMSGGLWLHRHVYRGHAMAHLVSSDRARLLEYGALTGLPASRLQFKPLKDPRNGIRRDAWHWDLHGEFLPPNRVLGRTPDSDELTQPREVSSEVDGRGPAPSDPASPAGNVSLPSPKPSLATLQARRGVDEAPGYSERA
jgi:hypothetical protein